MFGRPQFLGVNLRALRPLGKVTKRHQGQIVVKNALKVDNNLRASRLKPERAGNGLCGLYELEPRSVISFKIHRNTLGNGVHLALGHYL